MATDVLVIVTYVGYGLVSTVAGNAVAFAVVAGPYLIVALALLARHRRPVVSARRRGRPTGHPHG
ncbi:hypothetical protein GCM10027614_16700 [Micromonospora vulcania]